MQAKMFESTNAVKRARFDKSTMKGTRVNAEDSTKQKKRATHSERAINRDRATHTENPNTGKRAKLPKRTKRPDRSPHVDRVFELVASFPSGQVFTSESLQKDAILAGVKLPEENGWWGAFFVSLGKKMMARRTGRYVRAEAEITKSRMLAEWARL